MAQTTATGDGGGWVIARIVSLLLAIGIAYLMWTTWKGDFETLWAGDEPLLPAMTSTSAVTEPAKPANPGLEECLAKRVGDVDQMKADGVINDAQYAQFKGRAEGLCQTQNPG